jgi:hypothetical protein
MADREAVSGTILGRLKKMSDQELKKFAWSQRKRAEGKKGGSPSDLSKHMFEKLGDYMLHEADLADEELKSRNMAEKKPKKGILSGIKAATESKPTMLTGPEPVVKDSQGKTIVDARVPKTMTRQMDEYEASRRPKIGALQNILGSRKTQTSGLSSNAKVRQAQLGAIFDNYLKNINQHTGKYKKASKQLNQQNITSTDSRTGLSKRVKKKPNMLSTGEYATDLLQKLNRLKEHTFTGGRSAEGRKYPDITVSNKDMRFVTQHLARELQKHAKNKNIFLGEADKSVLSRLSADVVLSDTGEVTRGGKLSGKDFHITSNIDDVNVPGLMIEDTNYGNILKGEEGGRAGEALHAEERSVTGSGEAYNRTQIPGNPRVDSERHLKPDEVKKLQSSQASSLSSVKPGDEPRVNVGHRLLMKDKEGNVRKMIWKGTKKNIAGWGSYPTISAPQSLLTMPVTALEDVGGPDIPKSGLPEQVKRMQSGDAVLPEVYRDPETGYLIEGDTKTEVDESKFLSLDKREDLDKPISQGDVLGINENKSKKLRKRALRGVQKLKGDEARLKMEQTLLTRDQMTDMQNWNEGRTPGGVSSGGVWEMDGGYDSEGKYVKKGAATKVNPPMPLEGFDKSRAAKFPPGPWLSGYVFESEGMHEKTKPVKYQPGPWKDDYNFPVEDPPDLKPPRKPGDAVSYVIQGQEKVEARKAAETNVPRKEIKPLKKTTKLTARYQLPLHDMNITQKVDPTPQQITESVNVKSSGIREWSQKEGPGSKETKVLDWKDPFGVNRKIFLGMPYLGLGVDVIQGLRVMKESKKSKKEFNLGAFIPAWAKKIAYGESIPRS